MRAFISKADLNRAGIVDDSALGRSISYCGRDLDASAIKAEFEAELREQLDHIFPGTEPAFSLPITASWVQSLRARSRRRFILGHSLQRISCCGKTPYRAAV
jgi:hypothetical protein